MKKRARKNRTAFAGSSGFATPGPNFLERGLSRKYSKRVVESTVKYKRNAKHKKDVEND